MSSRSRSRSRSPKRKSHSRSRDRRKDRDRDRDRDRKNRDKNKDRDRRRRRSRSRSRERARSRKGNWDSTAPPGAEIDQKVLATLVANPGLAAAPRLAPVPVRPSAPLLPTPTYTTGNIQEQKSAKTVYVGNVQYGVTEPHLRELFGHLKVDRVTINHEKFYAFVDFMNPEDATAALSYDGVHLANYELRVRRPNLNGPNTPSPQDNEPGMYDESGLVALGPASQAKLSRRFASVQTQQNSDLPYDY